ncbi:MAG: discoidin domain-containing protein [Planctomycetia bacterium]
MPPSVHARLTLVAMITCAWITAAGGFPSAQADAPQTLEARLLAEGHAALAAEARQSGDARRGAAVFHGRLVACSACHAAASGTTDGKGIGPSLTSIDPKAGDAAVVESILEPSKVIAPAYAPVTLQLDDGRVVTGLVVEETAERIVLRDGAQPDKLLPFAVSDIESRQQAAQSIMPAGQVNQLENRGQFLDLVKYVLEVRDGGAARARELEPPPDTTAEKYPADPQPWQPVVQRGDMNVGPAFGDRNVRCTNGIAIGFAGGSVVFDAHELATAAAWSGGFVKHSGQAYFGVSWNRVGTSADTHEFLPGPLRFREGDAGWRGFEPATTSDPNAGSRFDGYQVGRSAVRLRYRGRVGGQRIGISEDIRVEDRSGVLGVVREFRFTGLPSGSEAAVAVSAEKQARLFAADGSPLADKSDLAKAAAIGFASPRGYRLVIAGSGGIAAWLPATDGAGPEVLAVSMKAEGDGSAALRVDQWVRRGTTAEPSAAEIAALAARPPVLDDTFPETRKPTPLPPEPRVVAAKATEATATADVKLAPERPAVDFRQNVDEFAPTRAKFLRFTITRTEHESSPGIDELEVYGAEPDVNLARTGTATASSVIPNYAIHQIAHLNDGKFGNAHSWIGAEGGRGWIQIEFPEPSEVQKVVWGRDRTGSSRDRLVIGYRIAVSNDGVNWTTVGTQEGRKGAVAASFTAIRDAAQGYDLETIPVPFAGCRPSDIAFGDDGVLYCLAMTEGQVWRTRIPPPGKREQVSWQRYATGLFHPIGLAVVDGRLYVAQKPEITELIDGDGDGTVERQRTVATGWGLSNGWHEYCFGLAVDAGKNLWFALNTGFFWNVGPGLANAGRLRGSILRIDHGTERLTEVATGCRVPNGIAPGPDGNMFFTDNQGDWIQSCKLAHIVPGRFYGHPETREKVLAKDVYPDGRSAVWLPHDMSRSSSGPVHDDTAGAFGPFADQIFVGDVGYGANGGIMRIALEKVDGEYQGACIPFIKNQPRGCERMKFGPDRRLYMATLTDGIVRATFNGRLPLAIHSVAIRPEGKGFKVRLTKPLAESCTVEPKQFSVKRWHYLYSDYYGSPAADLKTIPVERADLSSDRTEIELTLPVETYPIGMVYAFKLDGLTASSSETLEHNEAWYTVHRIPK